MYPAGWLVIVETTFVSMSRTPPCSRSSWKRPMTSLQRALVAPVASARKDSSPS